MVSNTASKCKLQMHKIWVTTNVNDINFPMNLNMILDDNFEFILDS
jgi:hypothetical protein